MLALLVCNCCLMVHRPRRRDGAVIVQHLSFLPNSGLKTS